MLLILVVGSIRISYYISHDIYLNNQTHEIYSKYDGLLEKIPTTNVEFIKDGKKINRMVYLFSHSEWEKVIDLLWKWNYETQIINDRTLTRHCFNPKINEWVDEIDKACQSAWISIWMEARENIVKLISNYINGEKEKNILLAQQQYTTIYKISSSLNGTVFNSDKETIILILFGIVLIVLTEWIIFFLKRKE